MSLKQEEPSMKRFPLVFLGLAIVLASYGYAFPLGEGAKREPVRAKPQDAKREPVRAKPQEKVRVSRSD